MGLGNRIKFLKRKLSVRELLLVLGGVVDMTFTNAFCVSYGYHLYEVIL